MASLFFLIFHFPFLPNHFFEFCPEVNMHMHLTSRMRTPGADAVAEIDPTDFLDPVDFLSKMDKAFYDNVVWHI